MTENKALKKILFFTTYPPRECGLATFTQDIIEAMEPYEKYITKVIAINDDNKYNYDDKVCKQINQFNREDYIKIAAIINSCEASVLVIEHEYGIFGGEHGKYILDLVKNINIPVVTTCHTILTKPHRKQKKIIKKLGKKSVKVVTMAGNTKTILNETYGIDYDKIQVIHHGVPKRELVSRDVLKKKHGYENRQIVSTFGLISPGKGIEHGIEAIAKVAKENKNVLYLILGQTHPALKEKGTAYRNKLEELVCELDIKNNVEFCNKYLTKDEIIEYLQLSDVYMTPYLGKDQASSGTMAYAVGYGKAIVSTPYLYAKEMLSEGRGLLAEFENPDSIAENISAILNNPEKQAELERKTFELGKTIYWDQIAQNYIDMFDNILNNI